MTGDKLYTGLAPADYEALSLVRADRARLLWLKAQRETDMERRRLLALAQDLGMEAHAYRQKAG